jgi:hypothetical protein
MSFLRREAEFFKIGIQGNKVHLLFGGALLLQMRALCFVPNSKSLYFFLSVSIIPFFSFIIFW